MRSGRQKAHILLPSRAHLRADITNRSQNSDTRGRHHPHTALICKDTNMAPNTFLIQSFRQPTLIWARTEIGSFVCLCLMLWLDNLLLDRRVNYSIIPWFLDSRNQKILWFITWSVQNSVTHPAFSCARNQKQAFFPHPPWSFWETTLLWLSGLPGVAADDL